VSIKGDVVYTGAPEYDCTGRMIKLSEKFSSKAKVTHYTYTKSGRIESVKSPDVTWTYTYDKNGNFKNVSFGIGSTPFEFEAGERISVGGFNKVTYSESGEITSRNGYNFLYNELGQLTKIIHLDKVRKEIIYDIRGRPIIVKEQDGLLVELIYTMESNPWLVTHAYLSSVRKMYRMSYDTEKHLIAIEDDTDILVVVADNMGTPHVVFNEDGDIIKKVTMSPFGTVWRDSNEDLLLPIGFHGGVDVQETGIVVIEGRPYDSIMGTWMVPNLNKILDLPKSDEIMDIHSYRFNKNDPINKILGSYMNTLDDWLLFFDFDLQKMAGPILDPSNLRAFKPHEWEMSHKRQMDLLKPSIQRTITLENEKRSVTIANGFHIQEPIFPNVILARHQEKISAYAVEGATMVEKMMADILDSTVLLDDYKSEHDHIYFVREQGFEEAKIATLKKYVDIQERLIQPFGKEICIQAAKKKLCGLSGIESVENNFDFSDTARIEGTKEFQTL